MKSAPIRLHATALLLREDGILIRGPSGSGKSALALALIAHGQAVGWFARLVADDTCLAEACHGRLLVRPHPATAGQVERRGLGIVAVDHASACVVRLVIDLAEDEASGPERLPTAVALATCLADVSLPRLLLPSAATRSERVGPTLDVLTTFRTCS